MDGIIRSPVTIALDKVCDLADTSASVFSELADMVVDSETSAELERCGQARAQAVNDLIVARQESGELPAAGDPERAALQAVGMKLESLVNDTEAMYHSLVDMDVELKAAVTAALESSRHEATVERALHLLLQNLEETAQTLDPR
ncbi:MAG: hypothetical protein KJO55_07465 [Gammaproteobacteria bacterium]|nr:hypothetical protein [Gammaproteobacteria bacterium]NND61224.1 hypothetical protein [Gammaproteobacteria bacterium]